MAGYDSKRRYIYENQCINMTGFLFYFFCGKVDFHGYRRFAYLLEWMGNHALSIFVLISSNLAIIAIQGFYFHTPENNIVSVKLKTDISGDSKSHES